MTAAPIPALISRHGLGLTMVLGVAIALASTVIDHDGLIRGRYVGSSAAGGLEKMIRELLQESRLESRP